MLLAVGSTLSVYPAASCVPLAAAAGRRVVIVNAGPTEMDALADAVLRGPISELLPALVAASRSGARRDLPRWRCPPTGRRRSRPGTLRGLDTRARRWPSVGFIHAAYRAPGRGRRQPLLRRRRRGGAARHRSRRRRRRRWSTSPTDDPPDEQFPHIYGPLPVAAVVDAVPWKRQPGRPWTAGRPSRESRPDR